MLAAKRCRVRVHQLLGMNKYTISQKDLIWVGCDLDATIAERIWPKEGIGKPIKGAVDSLWEIKKKGFKIIIFTARDWSDYVNVKNWLKDNNFPFDMIICGKPLLRVMIDDKAIGFDGDWEDTLYKVMGRLK